MKDKMIRLATFLVVVSLVLVAACSAAAPTPTAAPREEPTSATEAPTTTPEPATPTTVPTATSNIANNNFIYANSAVFFVTEGADKLTIFVSTKSRLLNGVLIDGRYNSAMNVNFVIAQSSDDSDWYTFEVPDGATQVHIVRGTEKDKLPTFRVCLSCTGKDGSELTNPVLYTSADMKQTTVDLLADILGKVANKQECFAPGTDYGVPEWCAKVYAPDYPDMELEGLIAGRGPTKNVVTADANILYIDNDGDIYAMNADLAKSKIENKYGVFFVVWFDTCDKQFQVQDIPADAKLIKFEGCGLRIDGTFYKGTTLRDPKFTNSVFVKDLQSAIDLFKNGKLCLPANKLEEFAETCPK